jgi:excisionase family DNA binding protein
MGEKFLFAAAVAKLRKCQPSTVRMAIIRGDLPAEKVGGMMLVRRADAMAWTPAPRGRPKVAK